MFRLNVYLRRQMVPVLKDDGVSPSAYFSASARDSTPIVEECPNPRKWHTRDVSVPACVVSLVADGGGRG